MPAGSSSRKRGARFLHLPAIPSPSENTQVKRNRSAARKLFTCVYHHGDGGQEKRSASETGNRPGRRRDSRANGESPIARAGATPEPPGSVPDTRGRASQGRWRNRPLPAARNQTPGGGRRVSPRTSPQPATAWVPELPDPRPTTGGSAGPSRGGPLRRTPCRGNRDLRR